MDWQHLTTETGRQVYEFPTACWKRELKLPVRVPLPRSGLRTLVSNRVLETRIETSRGIRGVEEAPCYQVSNRVLETRIETA
jgi:hypothetical protein